MAATERLTMAKAKGRPKTSERKDVTVKIDRTVVGQAKLVAAHKGIPVAELLSDLVGVPLARAYAQMLRELEAKGGKS